MEKVSIGVIGCGNISSVYLKNCTNLFKILDVAACTDLSFKRAESIAEEFGIPKVCSVDEILSDKNIEIILNLTIPAVHAEIYLKSLEAGKHVYSEKPIAINNRDAIRIITTAKAKGLLVGCAPDTFMGGALQTCRNYEI